MAYVFCYGTLKIGKCNHHILGGSKSFISEAITSSKEFTMFGGAFPFVSDFDFENPDANGCVIGELYEINDAATLANIDRLEGVPHLYIKREVDVFTLDNREYKATLYLASARNNERLKTRMPMRPHSWGKYLEWN